MTPARWPLREAYFWEEAPLLRPLLALCAGIIAYDFRVLRDAGLPQMLGICAASGIALAITSLVRRRAAWMAATHVIAFATFFSSLGWCAYACTDGSRQGSYFGHRADSSALHIVRIEAPPQIRPATTKYTVHMLYATDSSGTMARISGKALLYIYHRPDEPVLGAGDTILVGAKWLSVRNSGNPFEFDNERLQRRRNIRFQQFASPDDVAVFGKASVAETGTLTRMHNWCDHQLRAYIRDTAALGLLQAMLLGDESGFDPELRTAYSQTGVIHIVSISGSHVAVLFLVVTWVLGWVRGRKGIWIRYSLGLMLVWLYVLIAGAPPSALRAALMFTIIALGMVGEREGHGLNTLLGAAFGLLVAEPAWLFSVGFQLSFLAVLSILLFYQPLYRVWPQTTWIGKWTMKAAAASVAAEILTAPLVIFYFHNFPVMFIVANLLAAVLVGIVALVGGIAVIGFCWWPALARLIGDGIALVVRFFNAVIVRMQDFNPVSLGYLHVSFAELFVIYALIAAAGVWWLMRAKRGLFIALPFGCLLLALLTMDSYTALRQERLVVYSNGRKPLVERISGQWATTLAGQITEYAGKPARIGWHAWKERKDSSISSKYFAVAGKQVIVLCDSVENDFAAGLPADVVVIARPLRRLKAEAIITAFSPKEIVLAQRPSRYALRRWRDTCAAHGIVLRNVTEDGAFILQ